MNIKNFNIRFQRRDIKVKLPKGYFKRKVGPYLLVIVSVVFITLNYKVYYWSYISNFLYLCAKCKSCDNAISGLTVICILPITNTTVPIVTVVSLKNKKLPIKNIMPRTTSFNWYCAL